MRVFTVVAVVWALAAGVATAQQSSPSPAPGPPKAKAPAAPPKNVAPGAPAVPHPNQLMILIRSTLLAANHANLTGNYTVLRELGTPGFQQTNNSARLAEIFRELRNKNIDLGPIAVLDAKLVRQPSIDASGHLRLSGFFPSRPEQVNFDLAFMRMGGRWRLHGIALNTTPNESPDAATGATAQPATPPPVADSESEPTNEPVAAAKDSAVTPPTPSAKTTKRASPAPPKPAAAALPDPRAKVEQLETNPAPQTKPKPEPEQSNNPFGGY